MDGNIVATHTGVIATGVIATGVNAAVLALVPRCPRTLLLLASWEGGVIAIGVNVEAWPPGAPVRRYCWTVPPAYRRSRARWILILRNFLA